MAYTDIASTEFDPGEPVKSEHGKTFFDNPKAIANHDDSGDTAPRVWADAAASDASAIASTATENYILAVSDTVSPDGHGKLVVPIAPSSIGLGNTSGDSGAISGSDSYQINSLPDRDFIIHVYVQAELTSLGDTEEHKVAVTAGQWGDGTVFSKLHETTVVDGASFIGSGATFDLTLTYSDANDRVTVSISSSASEELTRVTWVCVPSSS